MPKYKVTVDTSYYSESFQEIIVEAETKSKAKYKAAKIFGLDGKDFGYFITLFCLGIEKVSDDEPLIRKYYDSENSESILKLCKTELIKLNEGE